MPVVAVINRKGGSGKSTLATHLAAYLSRQGLPVMLGDTDRNRSSQLWLDLRRQAGLVPALHAPADSANSMPLAKAPPELGLITGRVVDLRNVLRAPPGTAHVVLDTPGGLYGFDLARVVCHADAVLMPVCPSMFDREAAAACWAELRSLPRVASGRCRVAAVGMRVDARTKALRLLKAWAQAQDLPFIGSLRDAQTYVQGAELGLSMFDLPPQRVAADLAEWAPLINWLRPVLHPPLLAPAASFGSSSVRPCFKPAAAAAAVAAASPPVVITPVQRGLFDRVVDRPPGITIPGALDGLRSQRPAVATARAAQPSAWVRRLDKVLDSVSISRWLARSG